LGFEGLGSGSEVWGLGFGFWSLGFGIMGLEFCIWVWGLGFEAWGLGLEVWGLELGVWVVSLATRAGFVTSRGKSSAKESHQENARARREWCGGRPLSLALSLRGTLASSVASEACNSPETRTRRERDGGRCLSLAFSLFSHFFLFLSTGSPQAWRARPSTPQRPARVRPLRPWSARVCVCVYERERER